MNIKGEKASDYVLKVCGQDDYLVGDYEILQFQYIQESIARDIVPTLVTISVTSVPSKYAFIFSISYYLQHFVDLFVSPFFI